MPRIEDLPEPWRSFFAEVDAQFSESVQLHLCGGFVVTQLYGAGRTTSDVDYLGVVPNLRSDLTELAGKSSPERAQRYTRSTRFTWTPSRLRLHLRITRSG
jgi:hypothetical protein